MEWYEIIGLCISVFLAVAATGGSILWLITRLSAEVTAIHTEVSSIHVDVKDACARIDKQGERIDKLVMAFMSFQRDTDKLIKDCQDDIADLKRFIPELERKGKK
jgi:peptidoglycan hydrolase CwlO-like protein